MVLRELITKWGFDVDKSGLTELEKGIDSAKSTVKSLAVVAAGAAASIGFLLNKAGQEEQTLVAFETMLGSAEKAVDMLKQIKDFADVTPFQTEEVVQASKGLLAFGVAQEDIIDKTRTLGNIASGVGKDKFGTLIRGFGKIKTKGKATMEELNMFLEAGVPILDELAKGFGVNKEQIFKMVSSGKVGFKEVDEALQRMTTGNGKFAGLMEKQSKTFLGMISTILGKFDNLAKDLGAKLLPTAKKVLSTFLKIFDKNRAKIMKTMTTIIQTMVKFLSALFESAQRFWGVLNSIVTLFTDWETIIRFVGMALAVLFGAQMLMALGNMAMGLMNLIKMMRMLRVATLLTNAAAMIIPLLYGAAIAAVLLIFEDLVAFMRGDESVTAVLIEEFAKAFEELEKMFSTMPGWVKGLINLITMPFRTAIRGIKALAGAAGAIAGGDYKGAWEAVKEQGMELFNTLGDSSEASLGNMLGFKDSPKPSTKGGGANVNNNTKIEVKVPEGMSPEASAKATQAGVKDAMAGVLRETQRAVSSPIVE